MDKTITRWPLDRLKPHPRQQALFSELDEQAFNDLVEDMRIKGQLQPVEALPDGTLVCGHQRIRAARQLGWSEIDVWVREDLAQEGPAAVEQRLITDNLHRRHLDKLDLGRCYLRLRELEASMPRDKRHAYSYGADTRDVIARKLGCGSGRNLDRYLLVLQAPREVQDAFSQGKLSLVEAGKVARLSGDVQAEIGAEIRTGRHPKAVVRKRLTGSESLTQRYRQQCNEAAQLLRLLWRLADQDKEADGLGADAIELLRRGKAKLDELLSTSNSG